MKSDPFKSPTAPWLMSSKTTAQNLNLLTKRLPGWLEGDAPHSDIVISTRARLARNLSDYPFPNAADRDELEEVVQEIYRALTPSQLLSQAMFLDMQKLGKLDRKFLVERRLISPPYADSSHPGMLVVGENEYLCVMVNEEDHLRIQSIQPGLNIEEAWRMLTQLDDELGEQLEYAFTDHFGYLTACPTNTGTGMRISLFVHLPALAMLEEIETVLGKLAPSEITVRGFYGEGTEVVGNIFQISNQLTLGRTDESIVKRMEEVAAKLLSLEADGRERLLTDHRLRVEDKVFRTIGILQNARMISSLEFLNLLSHLRLGLDVGLLKNVDRGLLNALMVVLQPAHLQKTEREAQDDERRDLRRAELVREKIPSLF
jgi:protein arginine kinase